MHEKKDDGAQDTRQQKREHFQTAHNEPSRKSRRPMLIAALAVMSLATLYVVLGGQPSGDAFGEEVKTVGAPGQDIRIPIAEVNDGKARFYNYKLANNQEISFFVVKSSDGVIRAAFNACDVCYEQRLGYHQEGDDMVCKKCGRHFPSVKVNELKGGCNPAPLERTVVGDYLVIKASDLQQGGFYF
jgi:uncharacterized membrane protein